MEIKPKDTLAWIGQSNCHYSQKQYKESIECLNQAIQIDPKNKEAWYNKGVNLFYTSSFPESLECLKLALMLDPGYEKARQFKQMAEDAWQMNQRMQRQREALAASPAQQVYLYTPVNGFDTLFLKTGPGIDFSIYLTDDGLRLLAPDEAESILQQQIAFGQQGLIGGIRAASSDSPGLWSPLQSNVLDRFLCDAEESFYRRIDRLGSWPSFRAFLQEEILFDLLSQDPTEEPPLEYWWLVGDPKQSDAIHSGVFIKPDDHRLPVFTSGVYADLMAQIYRESYQVELQPSRIECLSCALSELHREIDSTCLEAALLNDQWPIRFVEQAGEKVFIIEDQDQHRYLLTGCSEQGAMPIWISQQTMPG